MGGLRQVYEIFNARHFAPRRSELQFLFSDAPQPPRRRAGIFKPTRKETRGNSSSMDSLDSSRSISNHRRRQYRLLRRYQLTVNSIARRGSLRDHLDSINGQYQCLTIRSRGGKHDPLRETIARTARSIIIHRTSSYLLSAPTSTRCTRDLNEQHQSRGRRLASLIDGSGRFPSCQLKSSAVHPSSLFPLL